MVEAFWAPVRNIEPASQMQNWKYDSEAETTPDRLPTLSISIEKVCFVVVKAREFDVKDVATIPDDGSNPTDDCVVGVLEDRGDDPVVWELTAFIGAMSEDEQVDLVTLMWLGRGDGGVPPAREVSQYQRTLLPNLAGLVRQWPVQPPLDSCLLIEHHKG